MTDIPQLIRAIKTHIAKGDKAKDKAEQHYIAAGQYLKQLKDDCPDQQTFLAKVEKEIGIGKSRTYELLQIGDGRKTVAEVRADTAKRTADAKDRLKLSATSGQVEAVGEPVSPEQEDADRQTCIALYQKAIEANGKFEQWMKAEHEDDPEASAERMKAQFANLDDNGGGDLTTDPSWRVLVTDASGKAWSNGVRVETKEEAVRYMLHALQDFVDADSPIIGMRTEASDDAVNISFARYHRGRRKGRYTFNLVFAHGTCGNFGWQEGNDTPAFYPAAENSADDGLDIPEYLRRDKAVSA